MKKHLVLPMLAVLGFTIVVSFFATTSVFAQDAPYSEEYMKQTEDSISIRPYYYRDTNGS